MCDLCSVSVVGFVLCVCFLPFFFLYPFMGMVRICSFNARGPNSSSKRSHILNSFHKQKVNINIFQETHFCSDHIPDIRNKHYPTWFHDSFLYSKSREVSIEIHKTLPHQIYRAGMGKMVGPCS